MSTDGGQYECDHPKQEVRYRQIAGHKELVPYLQCLECGHGIRAVKSEYVDNKIKLRKLNGDPSVMFDESIRRRWLEARMHRPQEEKGAENREWWARYNAYLESREWKMRRALVLERCSGLCEGCRKQNADQVHHLTYAHMGNELLFELAAVCEECHRKLHPHMEEEEDAFSIAETG